MNGNVALHALVEPALAVAPLNGAPARKPAVVPTAMEIEIGKAVAAGVVAIAIAATDYVDRGAMSASAKTWCGGMLGHVAELRLAMLGEMPDFREVAYTQARRALQEHPGAVLLTRFGKRPVDEVIDELIGFVLVISAKVVDDELALRAN